MVAKNRYRNHGLHALYAAMAIGIIFVAAYAQRPGMELAPPANMPIAPIKDILMENSSFINKTVSFEGYTEGVGFGNGGVSVWVWDVDTTQFPESTYGKTDRLKDYSAVEVLIEGYTEVVEGQKVSVKGTAVIGCSSLVEANPRKYFCIKASSADVRILDQTDIQRQKALCRNLLFSGNFLTRLLADLTSKASCWNLIESSLEPCGADSDCGLTGYNYPECVRGGLSEEEHSKSGHYNGRKGTYSCKCVDSVCRFA